MAFNYKPTPTGYALHESDKFLKMIVGPYGSGKSCACAVDVLINACAQPPAPDGVRYCRVGAIRSTYTELKSTTRRSLLEVLPRECGTINMSGAPMDGRYIISLPDGTKLFLELELWAVATEDDCESIKSCNWTFAWMNEATGCTPDVYNTVTSRVARYPSEDMGGIRWGGIIMDFNQPSPGTWLADFIKNPESNWAVFTQPPAAIKKEDGAGNTIYEINPNAENLNNLGQDEPDDPPDFPAHERGMRWYRNQISGLVKTGRFDKIDNQYCMLDVPIVDGKPVYSNFQKARHVAKQEIIPNPFDNIIIGLDQSGIHPAGVVLQNQKGVWCVLEELYADNEGFENFMYGMLVPLLRQKYANNPVIAAIDPSNQRDSWQAITPRERLAKVGIVAITEMTNSPRARIQNVEHMLNLYTGGLLVSPTCDMLVRGFLSEYRYRRLRAAGTMGAVYTPQPEKNEVSHVHDALQYAALYISMNKERDDGRLKQVANAVAQHRKKLTRVV